MKKLSEAPAIEKKIMKKPSETSKVDMSSLSEQAYQECLAMAKYALASGKRIPQGTMEILQKFASRSKSQNIKSLVQIHEKLARVIAPATPQTILILETEAAKKNFFNFLGLLPLVRRLMLAAFIFLTLFIGVQTFPEADLAINPNILDTEYGIFLLLVLTLIAAAGLGASFAALFQVNRYITSGTYDPKYESSYWIRFILGIISGLTLSILIPPEWYKNANTDFSQFAKPLLAMLGGFSTTVVYRILSRLVETVESLITGSKEEEFSVKEQQLNTRFAEEDFHNRQELAVDLMNIMQQIEPQTDPLQIKDQLNTLLKKVSATTDYELTEGEDFGPEYTDEVAMSTEDSTPKTKPPKNNDDRDESV